MPKKFLTVNDVARLLGVSPLTVRNWDAKGKLVAYRNPVNNYRIYKTEDVEGLLKQIEESKGLARVAVAREPALQPTLVLEPEPAPQLPRKLEITVEE